MTSGSGGAGLRWVAVSVAKGPRRVLRSRLPAVRPAVRARRMWRRLRGGLRRGIAGARCCRSHSPGWAPWDTVVPSPRTAPRRTAPACCCRSSHRSGRSSRRAVAATSGSSACSCPGMPARTPARAASWPRPSPPRGSTLDRWRDGAGRSRTRSARRRARACRRSPRPSSTAPSGTPRADLDQRLLLARRRCRDRRSRGRHRGTSRWCPRRRAPWSTRASSLGAAVGGAVSRPAQRPAGQPCRVPSAVRHQHPSHLGARAALPDPRSQRRDQHRARQPRAGARTARQAGWHDRRPPRGHGVAAARWRLRLAFARRGRST